MFTKNYENYILSRFRGSTIKGTAFDGSTYSVTLANTSQRGLMRDLGHYMKQAHCETLVTGSTCTGGIYFGSGISAPTAEDYALEYPITSGLAIVNVSSVTMDFDDGQYTFCTTIEITNEVSVDISISEIGLFGQTSVNSQTTPVLHERTVLETPIVIAPGETKAIRYWVKARKLIAGN